MKGKLLRAARVLALATVTLGMLAPRWCYADDQGVVGLKLVLIDKYSVGIAKAVVVSRDTTAGAIHNDSGSGNPADVSGTVRICETSAPANVAVYSLPSPWVTNKPTISKYVNAAAAPGAAGAKVLAVKPATVLKFVGKNLGDGDAASGDDNASDLNLNDPPGTCTLVAGVDVDVEVEVVDAAGPGTHHMCARFTIDIAKPVAGGTGCKVISRTSVAGPCGVCTGAGTTTTTSPPTTTTTAPPPPPPPPPCGAATAPACDGGCAPGTMCVDLGGFCGCVPSGGAPCGGAAPAPLCFGDCPFPVQACVSAGGICVCRDTALPAPPVCPAAIPPQCDGDCGGPGAMCVAAGPCMCVPSGGVGCGLAAPYPTCYGECPAGLACRTSLLACVCAP